MGKTTLLKSMILLCALIVGSTSVWAIDVLHYTLDGTKAGTGSGYGTANDIAQNDMNWKVTGNTNMNPWRIGGNSITNTDRPVYSISAMGSAITKIELTVGAANSITVNSLKLLVYNNSDLADEHKVDEVTQSFAANSTITFNPTSPKTEWTTGAFYKIVFNVTVSGSTNKFIEFKNAKFYKEGADVPITGISIPATADVPVGKTRTLTATVTPDNHTGSVDWESDDESIATVSSEGVVTGVAVGSTTIRAKSHSNNTINAECVVTVGEDVATLPFNWAGGSKTNLLALYGVTGNSLGDYTDNATNRPYLVQFNAVGDYIQIRTNGQPGVVYVGVKMLGGATTSKIKVQESSDGSVFTDVEEFTVSGEQNDEHTFKTSIAFNATSRFVRIIKSVHATGGNIGVGPIKITGCEAISTASGKTYATYVTTNDLDFSSVSGAIKAYVAASSTASKGVITFTGKNAVPAGTPLLIKTTTPGATVNVPVAATTPDAVETNYLVAGTGSAINYNDGGKYNYILTNGQFKAANNSPVAEGKAYLSLPSAASANELTVNFEDGEGEVTGIKNLTTTLSQGEGVAYNLAGQRVNASHKGLVIVNGKKYLNK